MTVDIRFLADLAAISIIVLVQRQIGRWTLALVARLDSRPLTRATQVLLAAGAAWLVLGFALSYHKVYLLFRVPDWFRLWVCASSYLWAFASTAGWIVYLAWTWLTARLTPASFNPGRRRLLNAAGAAAATVPMALTGYGVFIGRTSFREREIDVPIPHLPVGLEGLRLLQLSDIHLSPFLSERELASVIDAANALRPHVALVTGDLISVAGDPLDACLDQLSRLRADAGVLGCMGNHEVYARVQGYTAEQGARLGIRFLRGQAERLTFGGATLNVAGVDYQTIRNRAGYLQGAERLIAPDAVNVLLSHNPDVFPVAAGQGFDLTLSGHTHGGQVTVELLHQTLNVARFFTPYVYGYYSNGPASLYVTRGIGTIGLPARIGAPPEISILRLKRA